MTINWTEIARKHCYPDEKALIIDCYYRKAPPLTLEEIAKLCEVSRQALVERMKFHDLPRRSKRETVILHNKWKGGDIDEEYEREFGSKGSNHEPPEKNQF